MPPTDNAIINGCPRIPIIMLFFHFVNLVTLFFGPLAPPLPPSLHFLPSFPQGAVSATYEAMRNQSPLVPAMGNITMSDLAMRRRGNKAGAGAGGHKAKNDSASSSSTNV